MKNYNWNWKHEIGLFHQVKQEMISKLYNLSEIEQYIYSSMISYYENHVSLKTILHILMQKKYETWEDTSMITPLELIPKLQPIPKQLQTYYRDLTDLCINQNPSLAQILDTLYNKAVADTKDYKSNIDLLELMFKKQFNNIISSMKIDGSNNDNTFKQKHSDNYESLIRNYLTQLQHDKEIIANFGKPSFDSFDILEYNKNITPYYAIKDLTGEARDIFILPINSNKYFTADIMNSVVEEIYPGKGHLLNYGIKYNEKYLDFGATSLINGWGKYCSWSTGFTDYSLQQKGLDMSLLDIMINQDLDFEKRCNRIYYTATKAGYNDDKAKDILDTYTQYPLELESAYMGGLAFVNLLEKYEPKETLAHLKDLNWTDAVWIHLPV